MSMNSAQSIFLNCNLFSCAQREKHNNDIRYAYSYSTQWVQNKYLRADFHLTYVEKQK